MENLKINGLIRAALGTAVIVGVLAVNGCIFGTPPPEGGEATAGLGSPAGVVEYIENAYTSRDIEDYKECLSTNFTFYFNPVDVGTKAGDYTIPPSWGYEDEIAVIENMFDEAYSIDINLVTAGIKEPSPSDTTFTAYNVQIRLLLMVDSVNGFVATGFVDFEFESYPNPKDETEKLWRVVNWWDKTEAGG
jgi:hypothetical protein